MKVSVLLPTFNQARFLPDALEGLNAQTFRDFELIACDDGSTDDTADILRRYGVRTVTHERNRGAATAINSAAALASGELTTWVSSDNVMYPDWLATLVKHLATGDGAVYSSYRRCKGGGESVVDPGAYHPGKLISTPNCFFGPSFLIRSEVWPQHRGGSAHDFDSWARVEESCWARGWGIGYVDIALCDYNVGDWCTARARPDLYDAPHWQAEAVERRKLTRNWLGDLIAPRIESTDEVLDLGCGIMPATGGRLPCKRHVGVDSFQPYLDRIGPPTVLGRLPDAAHQFADRSFDVVLLLDVIEHLEKPEAMDLIKQAERIARREVILFTPDGYVEQGAIPAWGMDSNPDQRHRCGFSISELHGMGYDCRRFSNATVSVLGTKRCG